MRYGRSIIKRANLGDGLFDALLEQFQLNPFDGTRDTGFAVRTWTKHSAFVFYITQETSLRTVFDPSACSFNKLEISEPKVTPFVLDQRSGTVEAFGTRSSVNETLTTLGKLSAFRLSISDVQLSPLKAIRRLDTLRILSYVKSVRVVDWEVSPGIIGNCTISSVDAFASLETLAKFGHSIASATLVTRLHDRNVPIGLYRDGAINIGVDLDDDPETYEELKHVVLEGQ